MGAPYRTRATDEAGQVLSETETTYWADDGAAPFFAPPRQIETDICDGTTASCKSTRTVFAVYDDYGNVEQEDQYGEINDATDYRTMVRTYSPNTGEEWILGLPTSETIFQGIPAATQVAKTDFYYDGTSSCTVASTNQTPTKEHLTRVVRWLNGGTDPETRMAYDDKGNVLCTQDARGNTTNLAYDSTSTFATMAINPLGHTTTTQYYGVDGVLMDNGLFLCHSRSYFSRLSLKNQ